MIYYFIHADDFIKEFEKTASSQESKVGEYHLLRFKDKAETPLYIVETFVACDRETAVARKQQIENGESIVTKRNVLPKTTEFEIPLVVTRKEEGQFSTIVSHNFCDNTTWENGTSDSTWTVAPEGAGRLVIDKSEIQFIHDLAMNGSGVTLTYFVWHPMFPGTPVPAEVITFDSLVRIFELGNDHFYCPPIGREIRHGLTTVQFNQHKELVFYGEETPLKLAKLTVSTDGHVELGGSYVTASFVTELK